MKHGFKVPITYEALDSILRHHFANLPPGTVRNIYVDYEHEIVCVKYDANNPRVGEAGEWPSRATSLVTKQDVDNA